MSRFHTAVLFALLMLALLPQTAAAFSTQPSTDAPKGNAANFADPDEQQPAFVTSSDSQNITPGGNGPSVTINQTESRENVMGLSQSFDQAYSRK